MVLLPADRCRMTERVSPEITPHLFGRLQMRKTLIVFAVFLIGCSPRVALPSGKDDEAEIMRLEMAWRAARIAADTAFLNSFYAPELIIQGAGGTVITRDTDIGLFATGVIRPESIVAEEIHVSRYDDVAIVTGVDHMKGTYGRDTGEGRLRFMDVLVRRDGRWRLVAVQGTWVGSTRPGRN